MPIQAGEYDVASYYKGNKIRLIESMKYRFSRLKELLGNTMK